jgi:phage FluMu gp28-like protein
LLNIAATCLGRLILDPKTKSSAHVLQFANGRHIYSLSSNPNALAGKRGHVKIDEFALHPDQGLLFSIAKPVTQWGGSLSIISTHRGRDTVFNQLIRDIREKGNPMGWHLYSYPIQKAVEEGIVARINEKSGRNETPDQFLKRSRSECRTEEDWLREYCCKPADESTAFITYEMLAAAQDPNLRLMSLSEFLEYATRNTEHAFYLGMDVARKNHLCVIDVGEKIGEVTHDRLRIEMLDQTYSQMEDQLYPLLHLPNLHQAAFDANGLGDQLSERAAEHFPWKVQRFKMTPAQKEQMAYDLHANFLENQLRIPIDQNLRVDLRGIKKTVTGNGKFRFEGETDDSHCDRFWAKALRQQAARTQITIGSELGW